MLKIHRIYFQFKFVSLKFDLSPFHFYNVLRYEKGKGLFYE